MCVKIYMKVCAVMCKDVCLLITVRNNYIQVVFDSGETHGHAKAITIQAITIWAITV